MARGAVVFSGTSRVGCFENRAGARPPGHSPCAWVQRAVQDQKPFREESPVTPSQAPRDRGLAEGGQWVIIARLDETRKLDFARRRIVDCDFDGSRTLPGTQACSS